LGSEMQLEETIALQSQRTNESRQLKRLFPFS